jgi:thymidylate kinase
MWTRDFSEEAIVSALAPRTQTWFRGEGRKIPPEDAALALAGVEPLAAAFLRVSWGDGSPDDIVICKRYLMGAAAWEAEAEHWLDRLEPLVNIALTVLQCGDQFDDEQRAAALGMKRRNFQERWRQRYQRILADAHRQIGRGRSAMARRCS